MVLVGRYEIGLRRVRCINLSDILQLGGVFELHESSKDFLIPCPEAEEMAKILAFGLIVRIASFCMAIISSSTPSHFVSATISGRERGRNNAQVHHGWSDRRYQRRRYRHRRDGAERQCDRHDEERRTKVPYRQQRLRLKPGMSAIRRSWSSIVATPSCGVRW